LKGPAEDSASEPQSAAGRAAGVSRELDAAIVRVRSSSGDVVGSGFLVDPLHIVTCAHVVIAALGRVASQDLGPDAVLSVDFPLIAPNNPVQVRVEAWRPIERDETGDIAVLSVIGEPPSGVIPVRLVSATDFWGHPFRAFGFPRRYDNGVWAAGVLRASQGVGWVQMETTDSAYAIEGGFSGGAVWDDDLAGVVGMTVAADSHSDIRAAYLITAETLMHAWPPLAQRTLPPCPYRGLYPFRTQDVAVFFGREDLTQRLTREVSNRPILALVGPSGSGKSSVLFAGLLPKLQQQQRWITVSMRPAQTSSPLLSLSGAILEILEPGLSETDRIPALHSLAELIRDGHLPEVIDRVIVRSQTSHVLLAVDQFEEVFSHDWQDVLEFTNLLLSAVRLHDSSQGPRFTVILTLRADFLDSALKDPGMATALEDSVIAIGQMGRDQLRSAIEGPLPQGVKYESGLVDRVLADVGEEPGSLPLLQFALTLLWERQERGVLTHAAYEQLGRVDGSLAAYAERVYSEQLLPRDRDQVRRLFTQLARPSAVGTPVRRIARPIELGEVRWQLAQRLAATRLLIVDRDPTGGDEVELVHEALITGWARLTHWIEDDRAFRAWQEQLRNSLAAWEEVHRDAGALLRGAQLAEAERWLSEREEDLGEAERNFVRASKVSRGRTVRRLWTAVGSLVLLLLATASLAGVVIWQFNQRAEGSLIAGSRDLASQAEALATSKPLTAMLLAATAYRMHPTTEAIRTLTDIANDREQIDRLLIPDLPAIWSVDFSPTDPNLLAISGPNYVALWDIRTNSRHALRQFDELAFEPAFSPDGKAILVGQNEVPGQISLSLWYIDDDRMLDLAAIKATTTDHLIGTRFSADGTMLAVCADGGVQIWEVATHLLLSKTGKVDSASDFGCGVGFTADKNLLYVHQGKVIIWGSRTHRVITADPLPQSTVPQSAGPSPPVVAIIPSGRIALLTDNSGTPIWWNVDSGKPEKSRVPISTLSDFGAPISEIQFTSNGRLALVSTFDGLILPVDVGRRRPLGAYAMVNSSLQPSLNAEGSFVAITLSEDTVGLLKLGQRSGVPVDGQIALLNDSSKQAAALTKDGVAYFPYGQIAKKSINWLKLPVSISEVSEPTLSPSGQHVTFLSDLGDKSISLIRVTTNHAATPVLLKGHSSKVLAMDFDTTGAFLASADRSELIVWSVASGTIAWSQPIPEGYVVADVVVSPRAHYVASRDANGRVMMWETSSTSELKLPPGRVISMSFSPRGKWLSVVTDRGTLLWDVARKQKLPRDLPSIGSDFGVPAKFSLDEQYLALPTDANGSQLVEVWSIPDLKLAGSAAFSTDFVFLPDSRELLVSGPGGVRTVSFDPARSLEEVCRITANGNLKHEWDRYAPGFKYVAACP
jgi:WD40 repeat protein